MITAAGVIYFIIINSSSDFSFFLSLNKILCISDFYYQPAKIVNPSVPMGSKIFVDKSVIELNMSLF